MSRLVRLSKNVLRKDVSPNQCRVISDPALRLLKLCTVSKPLDGYCDQYDSLCKKAGCPVWELPTAIEVISDVPT